MKTTARLWGHSVAIRLPRAIASDAGIKPGTEVELVLDHGRVVMQGCGNREAELRAAADALRGEYENSSELTAFTALDGEPFLAEG